MQRKWIEDSNTCPEKELAELLMRQTIGTSYYLACFTDQYLSGAVVEEQIKCLDLSKLLEIRSFSEDREFLARRSYLGQPFQWRIASEKNCRGEAGAYLIRYQFLDINANETKELEDGNVSLMTTVGGRYSLPIRHGMDRVKLIVYLDYDSEGMASVADYRVCGFECGGEVKNSGIIC